MISCQVTVKACCRRSHAALQLSSQHVTSSQAAAATPCRASTKGYHNHRPPTTVGIRCGGGACCAHSTLERQFPPAPNVVHGTPSSGITPALPGSPDYTNCCTQWRHRWGASQAPAQRGPVGLHPGFPHSKVRSEHILLDLCDCGFRLAFPHLRFTSLAARLSAPAGPPCRIGSNGGSQHRRQGGAGASCCAASRGLLFSARRLPVLGHATRRMPPHGELLRARAVLARCTAPAAGEWRRGLAPARAESAHVHRARGNNQKSLLAMPRAPVQAQLRCADAWVPRSASIYCAADTAEAPGVAAPEQPSPSATTNDSGAFDWFQQWYPLMPLRMLEERSGPRALKLLVSAPEM